MTLQGLQAVIKFFNTLSNNFSIKIAETSNAQQLSRFPVFKILPAMF